MPAEPNGAPLIGPMPSRRVVVRVQRVARQERREVGADADRTHARPAAAVRDAEGLVQVQVADVAELADAGDADAAR